jgi:hypothetical protein
MSDKKESAALPEREEAIAFGTCETCGAPAQIIARGGEHAGATAWHEYRYLEIPKAGDHATDCGFWNVHLRTAESASDGCNCGLTGPLSNGSTKNAIPGKLPDETWNY